MSAYDAILLDLDGTLVGPDERISDRNRAALHAAAAAGKIVMVATGRSKISALSTLDELGLPGPVALFNGSAIWCTEEDRMLRELVLPVDVGERLHAWGAARDAQVMIMTAEEKLAVPPRNAAEERNFQGFIGMQYVDRELLLRPDTIRLSFLVDCAEDAAVSIARELESVAASPVYVSHFPLRLLPRHEHNSYVAIDVHAPCEGKAEALRFLAETRGIPAERVIAVGDADNDLTMLRAAGLGVAMANAQPDVHAAADRTIGHNGSDAIARLVEEMLLAS